ncbi:hypothetical protein CUU66_17200 [Peribacillus deserti]|uniref:Uncharacterized protein n=1 Tax=Peribacillus deserti TaxID=673318 RepID=A0A2N5M2P2_9BACI|nr:hypothetical protein CUU66_17200 [Peribacillus deserti]
MTRGSQLAAGSRSLAPYVPINQFNNRVCSQNLLKKQQFFRKEPFYKCSMLYAIHTEGMVRMEFWRMTACVVNKKDDMDLLWVMTTPVSPKDHELPIWSGL